MGEFNSPLGKKKFASTPMREFDIPDESETMSMPPRRSAPEQYQIPDMSRLQEFQNRSNAQDQEDMADIEQQMRQARQDKVSGKSRINPGAKHRLEMLLGMTRTQREVEVSGVSFVLQTLKARELREATLEATKFDNTVELPFELQKQILARSLVSIDGTPLEIFIGSNELEARLSFIDEQDIMLVGRLNEEYQILYKESMDKYAIKTVEDAQEVAEDLKKS